MFRLLEVDGESLVGLLRLACLAAFRLFREDRVIEPAILSLIGGECHVVHERNSHIRNVARELRAIKVDVHFAFFADVECVLREGNLELNITLRQAAA